MWESQPFGLQYFGQERRKFAGRRLGLERRVTPDRRSGQRRVQQIPVPVERRSGRDRRSGQERRAGERRSLDDRRSSAWRALEGE